MRRVHTKQESTAAQINLTPLIDVVFILLIFFLVTASFTRESGISVDRPVAQTAVQQGQANIVVGITAQDTIWVDKQQVDLRSVRMHIERVHSQNPEGSVIILADKNSQTGTMVAVLDQVRLAGVSNIAVATKE